MICEENSISVFCVVSDWKMRISVLVSQVSGQEAVLIRKNKGVYITVGQEGIAVSRKALTTKEEEEGE